MPDPDPYQNVTDPEHWMGLVVQIVIVVGRASGGGGGRWWYRWMVSASFYVIC